MKTRGMRYRKHDSGFTLVELLLALTLMSMLLALAYGGFRASTRATDKGQQVLEQSGKIRMAHQFVRRQLNQMLPLVFDANEDMNTRSVFEGETLKIRFVAPMPGYLGFGGPQVQELSIVDGEEGLELVLSHAVLQGFEESHLYERPPIVLLDKIESASFDFIGLDEFGTLISFEGSWPEPEYLPKAVTLDIEFRDDVYIQWPLLTAAVRIDASALSQSGLEVSLDKRRRNRLQPNLPEKSNQ